MFHRCGAGDLAGKFGLLMPGQNFSVVDNTGMLMLEGINSIVGRSVVIHSNQGRSDFVCGTVRRSEELTGTYIYVCECT